MPRYPFILLRNPRAIGGGMLGGHVESRHRTLANAIKAQIALNRACQRVNGRGTWIPSHPVQVDRDWPVGSAASGTDPGPDAMFDAHDEIGGES